MIDDKKLLMMFIKDAYSPTGNITKKTAITMSSYVCERPQLKVIINNGNRSKLLSYSGEATNDNS